MIEAGAQKEMIPVEQSFAAWRKDPEYVKAYNAIGDEFTVATATAMQQRISISPALAK
ncbi:MAG: hypothetical protein WB611_12380 [Stellaceae bacterium]